MKHFLVAMLLALLFVAAPLHAEPDKTLPKKSAPQRSVEAEAASGAFLNPQEASDLEEAVAKNPEDLSGRAKLMGYYVVSRPNVPDAKENRRKHIFWMIKNHPEAEIAGTPFCTLNPLIDYGGYQEGKQLWVDQLRAHPQDATIISHAASFLTLTDRELAAGLLQQAIKLEPTNPKWHDELGALYALTDNKNTAAKALAEFEKAQAADPSAEGKFQRLHYLAKSAFSAAQLEKASDYAEELLQAAVARPKDRDTGNSIHQGNIVLGRVALKQRHIKLANEYLLKAGHVSSTRQLSSFGPNMSLANELLKAGQKAVVLQYFELCYKFWDMGRDKLEEWTKQVKAGKTPQFGPQLAI
jgi:tetratricopeptide (TPR) repeat protein